MWVWWCVRSALLIHDLRNTSCAKHPSAQLHNPYELFTSGSFHGEASGRVLATCAGGVWRAAWAIGSIGEVRGGVGGPALCTRCWRQAAVTLFFLNKFKYSGSLACLHSIALHWLSAAWVRVRQCTPQALPWPSPGRLRRRGSLPNRRRGAAHNAQVATGSLPATA